ncbi:MAG TPA: hypothetical protein VFN30_10425, partial [Chitinophagaceae bacterium]|nr:hypothetical protein [Chitinophagaceae bacterium]
PSLSFELINNCLFFQNELISLNVLGKFFFLGFFSLTLLLFLRISADTLGIDTNKEGFWY